MSNGNIWIVEKMGTERGQMAKNLPYFVGFCTLWWRWVTTIIYIFNKTTVTPEKQITEEEKR